MIARRTTCASGAAARACSTSARRRRRRACCAPRPPPTPPRACAPPAWLPPRPCPTPTTSTWSTRTSARCSSSSAPAFPYNAKLCLNGHEYVKRQLQREGIAFEALDNGFRRCADPQRLQALCRQLTAARIDAVARKGLARLPHPFTAEDRMAGMLYHVSVLQAECSLTQVFDRPLQGRVLFEEVIRENLDLGRPDHVQLVFQRRVTKRTPSRFRTRVITHGVDPSLHCDYKRTRSKQYFKQGRALRTETTINDTYDFGVGRRLNNLEDLKTIGFQANRRLLRVERLSHDATLGATCFEQLHKPSQSEGQRAPALRFGDPRVQALLAALLAFRPLPRGFDNRQLGARVAPLLGHNPAAWKPARTTYDLRRLRLRGLIERIPRTRRYRVTRKGLRTALCFHRTYARVLRPTLSVVFEEQPKHPVPLQKALARLDCEVDRLWKGHPIAA